MATTTALVPVRVNPNLIVLKKPQPVVPAPTPMEEGGKKKRRKRNSTDSKKKRRKNGDNNNSDKTEKKLKHNGFERVRRKNVSSAIDKSFSIHQELFAEYRHLSGPDPKRDYLDVQASKEKHTTEGKIMFDIDVVTFLQPLLKKSICNNNNTTIVEKTTTAVAAVCVHCETNESTQQQSPPPLYLSLAGYDGSIGSAFLYSNQCCFLDGNLRFHSLFHTRLTRGIPIFDHLTMHEKDRAYLLSQAKTILEDNSASAHWTISKEMFITSNTNEILKAIFTIKRYMIVGKEESNNLFSFGCLHVEVYLRPYTINCSNLLLK